MKRTFQIYRYDPDQDAKPRMQTMEVELDGHERMLLDALMKIKAQDPSLSFRRSCREGVCGSDAMNINGKNGLACITNMQTLKGTVVLKPLPGLPVIRDLIVDMTQFFKQYDSIKPVPDERQHAARKGAPAIARRARRTERLVRMHPVRELLDQLSQLLVEPRQVRRAGRLASGVSIYRRQSRPGDRRAAGQLGRSVPALSLPFDHELRRCLPEESQPDSGHRQDQGTDGAARGLIGPFHFSFSEPPLPRVTPVNFPARPDAFLDAPGLSKLRWRCRRGLLENDLLIERFFVRCNARLTIAEADALHALMELSDNDLLDILLRRHEAEGIWVTPAIRTLIDRIRVPLAPELQ